MATEWKSQQADGMYYLQFETDNKEKYMLVENAAQMAIDGKTTANYAEVKHGEWIQEWEPQPLLDDYDEIPYIKCSLCGHEEWNIDIESGNAPNYCENCGTIMRGETNGEK